MNSTETRTNKKSLILFKKVLDYLSNGCYIKNIRRNVMKTNILLALVALMSTGCFSAHAHVTPSVVFAPPPPAQPAVVITPGSVSIQWHYVYVNTAWVRRPGPPPRGAVYHAHPRHRNSVIVQRSSGHRNHVHRGHAHRPVHSNTVHKRGTHHRSTR